MFTIDCNDQGASYTEAKANFTLSQYLQKPHLNTLNKFLPRHPNILENDPDFQVSIQVTLLACGGLVIGACVFHRVVDIATMVNFIRTWASFCRGDYREFNNFQDLSLGSSIFPQLTSLFGDYNMANYGNHYFSQGKNYSVTRRFVFNASAIAVLREKAKSDAVPNPSRIEALTGFICKRLMVAVQKNNEKPPSLLFISHAVNIRKRWDPPLPENAFGNFTWFAAAFYSLSESEMEVSDCVETMREALEGINGENLKELEPERAVKKLIESIGIIYENDEVRDYRPVWVAHMGDAAKGRTMHQFMFIEGKIGGEIELWMLFSEEEMAMLENDPEFIAFATPNPSISI
ncbi:hypothetical protein DH2020_010367 [Rehmannia glutinosa]|uniref:Uncharacterized protein n=1 Tax=Rehmannia glutinosa TaxID=99300 RepID=A0ABR0XAH1_REHGL